MAKGKKPFEPVDPKVNFPEKEKELLSEWDKKGIVKKYLQRNKNSKKNFSFLDGPMTANNPMGVHHAWGRTYKDLWQRYYNMKGYKGRFQNGFDAQGLWVEVEVEKELGFKNKKEIESFGVDKFVQLCRDRVKKYADVITQQSKRLGYFMDWDNSYFTLSEDNNYMIWHFLKICAENGWIYKGNDSVPWCPRCETAISQHEMLTEDYKEITHDSVFLAFPLAGQENEYLLVWTTTPWTIPANIAVAVDTSLEYAKVEFEGKNYWIAKDSVERVFAGLKYKIIKTVKGERLVGLRYSGAFDDLPAVSAVSKKYNDKFHSVIPTDNMLMPITTTEGTGLVHTAVSAGTEDFKLGQKLGLPMIPVIEDDARYMDGFGFLSGQNAKKHPELILEYLAKLKEEGKEYYLRVEKYTHRYPACWRCKTELVWKVTDEWYIAMDKPVPVKKKKPSDDEDEEENETLAPLDLRTLRQRMIEVTRKISWIPGFGLDREIDWLTNMHDWLISKKNRYWGLALPIWECKKCGNFEVIGSKEELKEKTVEGWDDFKNKTPHKPFIDKVKLKCSKCGQTVSRIEPVGNPWLDAGIVAYSTVSENNKACNFDSGKTRPLYMTDKEEWKKWVPADFITESFPGQFKNWFYALIAMSTVLEDMEPFRNVLGFATLFAEDGRPMHKSWGNSIEFNEGADTMGVDVMRWMFVRQNPSENMLFGYRNADETRRKFHLKLWNIYNFFVTYANLDGWVPGSNPFNNPTSKNALDKWILIRLNETILNTTEDLDRYDAYSGSGRIETFVDDLSLWFIRRSRDRVGPASESERDKNSFYQTTYYLLVKLSQIMAPFTPFISDMIYKNLTAEESVHLADWPKQKVSAEENEDYILYMKLIRDVTEKVHAQRKDSQIPVRQPLSSLTVFTKPEENYPLWAADILSAELNVKNIAFTPIESAKKDTKLKSFVDRGFYLDTAITPELEEEALARELVRKIQSERKEMGLNLTQKVKVTNNWLPKSKDILNWLTKKAQISELSEGEFRVKAS